ncbi:MAG: hypothetical protein WBW04_14200 [Nitrolancea sp.]
MHARVLSAKIKRGCLEQLEHEVRDVILPSVSRQPGYCGGWGLVDASTGNGMLVTFWETARDLEENECNGMLAAHLMRVNRFLDGPTVRETFEVMLEQP